MELIYIFILGFCIGILGAGFILTVLYKWMDDE